MQGQVPDVLWSCNASSNRSTSSLCPIKYQAQIFNRPHHPRGGSCLYGHLWLQNLSVHNECLSVKGSDAIQRGLPASSSTEDLCACTQHSPSTHTLWGWSLKRATCLDDPLPPPVSTDCSDLLGNPCPWQRDETVSGEQCQHLLSPRWTQSLVESQAIKIRYFRSCVPTKIHNPPSIV